MATNQRKELRAPDVKQNVVVNIQGEEKLKSFGAALNDIAKGNALQKYWKDAQSLVNDTIAAYNNFAKVAESGGSVARKNAEELVKTSNALKAVSGTDFSNLAGTYTDLTRIIETAEKLSPAVSSAFSVDKFKGAFESFELLRAEGLELSSVFQKLGAGTDVTELNKTIDDLSAKLVLAENTARDLKFRFDSSESGREIQELDNQIDDLESKMSSLTGSLQQEVDAFLRGNNLEDFRYQFRSLFEDIENGELTAGEAISSIRYDLRDVISGGETNVENSVLQRLIDKLEEVYNKVEEVRSKIGEISTPPTVSQTASDSGIVKVAEDLSEATNAINRAEVDEDKLRTINRTMSSVQGFEDLKINSQPFVTLSQALKQITDNVDVSKIAVLSAANLNWLSDLKVSKASMSNLATYLPTIADVNVSNLKALSDVNLTNFNNIKVSKSSLEPLAGFADAASKMLEAADKVRESFGVIGAGAASSTQGISEPVNEFGQNVDKVTYKLETLDGEVSGISGKIVKSTQEEADSVAHVTEQYDVLDGQFQKVGSIVEFNIKEKQKLIDAEDQAIAKQEAGRERWENSEAKKMQQYEAEEQALLRKANEAQAAYDVEIKAQAELVNVQEQSASAALKEGAAREAAIGNALQLLRQMQSLGFNNKMISDDDANLLSQYTNQLEGMIAKLKSGEGDVENMSQVMRLLKNDFADLRINVEQAYGIAKQKSDEHAESLKREEEQTRLLSQAESLRGKMVTAQSDWSMINEADKNSLDDYVNQLNALTQSAANNEISTDYFKDSLSELSNNFAKLSVNVRSYGGDTKLLTEGTVEYGRAMQQAQRLMGTVNGAIASSTKAQNGISASDYSNLVRYKEALSELLDNLRAGKVAPQEFADKISNLQSNITASTNNIKQNGEYTKTWGERLEDVSQKFTAYFSVTRVIMAVYRYTKQLVSVSVELDDAMTQRRIVTNETNDAYEKYGNTIARTAKEISSSMTDLIDATTTYARLGYSLDESSMLAKYTSMLQEVGDIDSQAAQDAITAIIKAFPKEADVNNIETVMDKLVTTGNGFPISVSQIAEGMNNASSMLASAGNTLDESIALMTAANTTVKLCRAA